jgi:DNA primase
MGANLNVHQFRQLCDSPRTVYVAFDADRNGSGQRAAQSLVCRLTEKGINMRTVVLPQGHDPNSLLIRDGGADQFRSLLEAAQ